MILYVLKRILHKKKSIFMQLLKSPIPPLTAAHLIVGGYFWNIEGGEEDTFSPPGTF